MDVRQRDVLFRAIRTNAARGLGREAEQRLDRGAGLRARLELQHLPQQRQRDDHRCRFEIHRDVFAHAKRGRKYPRRNGGDDAVHIGGANPQSNQRPHVRAAVADRLCAAHEERPA
ncbi:hypothetical protein SDC9_149650 [bioreactor metagenome]|uniref:Uncharacterized protein n=1 Tax=bioreactor metagenome TaxID=1076179 RepID=A0A645EP78_9ZZZZ